MHATTQLIALAAALPQAIQPSAPDGVNITKIIGGIGAILAVLIAIGALIVAKNSGKGDVKKAANSGAVSGIAIAMFAVAGLVGVLSAWAGGLLTWATGS